MQQEGSNKTQVTPIHWEGTGTLALKKIIKDSAFITQKNPHNTPTKRKNPTTNHPYTKKLIESAQYLYLNLTADLLALPMDSLNLLLYRIMPFVKKSTYEFHCFFA